MSAIGIYPGATSKVSVGGQAVVVVYPGALGGLIINPLTIVDQGLSSNELITSPEALFVNFYDAATPYVNATTIEVFPGGSVGIPFGLTTNVTVNAPSSGHLFTALVFQTPTPFPPAPVIGPFPPNAPTGLVKTIPSYLYQEYNDDDSLQAFVMAFNSLAQTYVDAFNSLNLPIYTQANISGALLDWVAAGLYGLLRPALSSGRNKNVGPFNTYTFNSLVLNKIRHVAPANAVVTNDDIFKRILTWLFLKGDGKVFNIRWLKRRVGRFLAGVNGTNPKIDQTYRVSVTFGANASITIWIVGGQRTVTGGALFNRFAGNTRKFNNLSSTFVAYAPVENALVFQEAVSSGALELPFQFTWSVSLT